MQWPPQHPIAPPLVQSPTPAPAPVPGVPEVPIPDPVPNPEALEVEEDSEEEDPEEPSLDMKRQTNHGDAQSFESGESIESGGSIVGLYHGPDGED